ncbi:hypothetical protein, partial [Helicobacter kayseriensis]|uniref:hypothetical protein n=1 Tax=Helicobacter kayseriensis TaxID=2905877 RepID=UPI001E4E2ACE
MKNTKTRYSYRYCSLVATSLALILGGGTSLSAGNIDTDGMSNTIFEKNNNRYGLYVKDSALPRQINLTSDLIFSSPIASNSNIVGPYAFFGILIRTTYLTLQPSNTTHAILFGNGTGLFGNSRAFGIHISRATLNLNSVALVYGTTKNPSSSTFDTGLYVYNPDNPNNHIHLYFGNNSTTNFGNIGGDSFQFAEGFSFKSKTLFEGKDDASINVEQVQANKATGILINADSLDMKLANSQIRFGSIQSSYEDGGFVINGSEDKTKKSKINLDNSQVIFNNITSNGDIAYGFYTAGMAPIILGDNSSKIIFENIENTGNGNPDEFGTVNVGGATGIVAQNSATYFFGDKNQNKGGGTIEFRKIKGAQFAQGMSDTSSDGNLNLNAYKTNFIFGNIEAKKSAGIKGSAINKINAEQSSFVFKKIRSTADYAVGLRKASIDAKASSFSFESISSDNKSAYGMDEITLRLNDRSSVTFNSIGSGDKAAGMVNSSISGGNVTFNKISGSNQAIGIDLSQDAKVSNGAQIIFNNIGPSKVTSGIYYDGSNKKQLTSDKGWGSIVFKKIQPSSEKNTDQNIDVLKLSNNSASLTIKNVSIAHGNPASFDNMLYGIYNDVNRSHFTFANTTATYEGVEGKDIAGNIIKSTTNYWNNLNQTIKVAQNTTGYGIYSLGGTLDGTMKLTINLDAKETRNRKASNTKMVGIYLKEGDLTLVSQYNLSLKNATNAIGILITQGNHTANLNSSSSTISLAGENVYGIVLEDGAKANINNAGTTIASFVGTSKTVGVLFKGKSALSGTLAFANWQKGNFIEAEKDGALNGSIKISAYSSTNEKLISTAKDGLLTLEAQGRIVLGSDSGDNNTYGLYSNLNNNPVYGLDNVTFNTRKDFTGSDSNQVYGIYSKQSSTFQLSEGSTLTFNVQKYKTDSGELFEGTAFGGDSNKEAKLILGNNSSIIFNANGGKLAEITSNESSHVHLNLAGNNPERFQKTASLELRSLEVSKFDLKDSTITLYASKDAIIASTGYTDGKAYTSEEYRSIQGGSDRLIIKGSDGDKLNNTLELQVDHIDNDQSPAYVVLAQVTSASKDKVIFNNLTSEGSTDITV